MLTKFARKLNPVVTIFAGRLSTANLKKWSNINLIISFFQHPKDMYAFLLTTGIVSLMYCPFHTYTYLYVYILWKAYIFVKLRCNTINKPINNKTF